MNNLYGDYWFADKGGEEGRHVLLKIDRKLENFVTDYGQHLQLLELTALGKTLIINGDIQSCEKDESIYHKTLVSGWDLHTPRGRVLILGGGTGAAAREVLEFPKVESVDIVDPDRQVVMVAQTQMRQWHQGAFADARVAVHYKEAQDFIRGAGPYNFVISDLTMPSDGASVEELYGEGFYLNLQKAMAPGANLVLQAGAFQSPFFNTLQKRLYGLGFSEMEQRHEYMHSYSQKWSFLSFRL